MHPSRSIIDLDGAPWTDVSSRPSVLPGTRWEVKILTAPDGQNVQLARVNGFAAPHIHTKASAGFIFEGELEIRGRTCGAGTWYLEPHGAIHPRTTFRNAAYGFGMRDGGHGNTGNIRLDDVDNPPAWVHEMGASLDVLQHAVDSGTLPWEPFGDGISMKILHVFERSSWFASMLKAEPGGTLPRRRYLGPADVYVMSGRARFADAVAEREHWIHYSAGARDDSVMFPIETALLVNTYGTVLEEDATGSITRVIDAYSLRESKHRNADQRR